MAELAAAPVAAANKPGWNCNDDDGEGVPTSDMCFRAIKSGAEIGRSEGLKNVGNWGGVGDERGESADVKGVGVGDLGLAEGEAAAAPRVEK